jgi:hypothetical protein
MVCSSVSLSPLSPVLWQSVSKPSRGLASVRCTTPLPLRVIESVGCLWVLKMLITRGCDDSTNSRLFLAHARADKSLSLGAPRAGRAREEPFWRLQCDNLGRWCICLMSARGTCVPRQSIVSNRPAADLGPYFSSSPRHLYYLFITRPAALAT